MQETRVPYLGQEDPRKKKKATHSSTLAWKIRWMKEPHKQQFMGSQRVGHNWAISLSLSFTFNEQSMKITINTITQREPFYLFIFFISWRLITLQYCSGFCHTLTWISHGFTCIPHPDPPSHLPLHLIPLGLPSAPGPSTCLMHPTWAGDLFHPR